MFAVARHQAAQAAARLDDFRAGISRADPGQQRAANAGKKTGGKKTPAKGQARQRAKRAVEGLDGTLAALRGRLAGSVLLACELPASQEAWIGPGLADAAGD